MFIARDDPRAADRTSDDIENRITMLARYPMLGPARPDIGDGVRSLAVGCYLVLYRIDDAETITIVRVVHGMRDVAGLV